MTPTFVTLRQAPLSRPSPLVLATRLIASVRPHVPVKWSPPSMDEGFRLDGHTYRRERGFGVGCNWREDFDGVFIRRDIPKEEITALFARYLDEAGPEMKATHDDAHAGAAVVVFNDGSHIVVLESFEYVARLLGSVQ